MNSYIVTPHEGIGSLKLGMSPEEILAAVQRDLTDLKIVSKRGIQISEIGNVTQVFRHFDTWKISTSPWFVIKTGRQSKFR